MKRWLFRIALVAAVLLAAWWLRTTYFVDRPIEVDVTVAQTGTVEATVTNARAGTIKARRRARLSPELGGTVAELPFREGDRVRAGDVVLRLEDSLPRARLEVAERDVATAVAERRRACLEAERVGRELERRRALAADGIVSTDQLDALESAAEEASAACAAAGSNADRARSAVGLASAELEKMVVRAPFDGVLADLATEVGEYSTPSPPAVPVPPVVDILDPTSIYVSAPMDEVDSARIRPGQPARLTVDSHRGESFAGEVVRVAPFVVDREEQNRTVEVEATFADTAFATRLLPGTSADVELVLERRDDVLRVPTASVIEGRRVLVLDGGRLRSVEIETGLRNWDFTEIRGGLDVGAKVVSSVDRSEVRDGALAVAVEE